MIIKIDNLSINYEVYGQGPRLLLLHGWADNLHSFDKIVPPLAQNFQVILIDLPGFGLSQMPKETYGVFDYANFVEKFLTELDIPETFLLGHSMGGAVALAYASSFSRAKKIILEDSAGIRVKSLWTMIKINSFKALKFFTHPIIREHFIQILGSVDYKTAGPMRKILIKVVNEDLRLILTKIDQPSLLIWGENDTTTPLSHGRLFENGLKNSKLTIFKNCDHFPHLEYQEEFVKLVTEFLIQ